MLRDGFAETFDVGFPPFVPPAAQSPAAARALVERYGTIARPAKSADARQALLHRLRLARYDWDKVAPSDRLDVVWVLWEGPTPPGEHETFLHGFLQWVGTPRRPLQAARLATAWTAAFDPALKSIHVVGAWLADQVAWLPAPWPQLAEAFDIFSIERGPVALASSFLDGEETTTDFFQRVRLPANEADCGLTLEMLDAAARDVERRLAGEPHLAARLCALSLAGTIFRPDAVKAFSARRTSTIRTALAEALLLPWQQQTPAPTIRASIAAFLLRHYGDARTTRETWAALRAPAAALMRRWLTEQTVMIYFHLAARSKATNGVQLAERQSFWMALLEHIDDAWLLTSRRNDAVLGPDRPAHGILGGCKPDQSALILRIGGLTILESSDATNESVWLRGNANAPLPYQRGDQPYWSAALAKSPDFSSAFNQKNNSTWQERLARFIGDCVSKAAA